MDPNLIEEAKAGDAAAMEKLLGELAPILGRYGRSMCRHQNDAEDVLQEALLAVAQNLPSFEGRSSISSWAYTLARTACVRKRRGMKNRPFLAEDAAPPAIDEQPDPEVSTVSRELRDLVRGALDGLADDHRDVLILRDVEGLTAPEAAEVLGIGVDALKSRLHRARAALREAIAPTLEGRAPPPRPGCPDAIAMLSKHLEGDLDATTCASMEDHVKSCPSCGPACQSLRSALAVCRAAEGPVPSEVKSGVQRAMRAWMAERSGVRITSRPPAG